MIEINLLPPEYRPREKTNLPLILALVAGVVMVGGIGLYGMGLKRELAKLQSDHETLASDRDRLKGEAEAVDRTRAEIARQKSRQDTIIKMSQSKIMWSLKLDQFARIMARFPTFWLTAMQLNARGRGDPELSMTIEALGRDFTEVSRFRDALKSDANFFYHFRELDAPSQRVTAVTGYVNASEKMTVQLTLPVASTVLDDPKQRRR